jgi:hypothetical protein
MLRLPCLAVVVLVSACAAPAEENLGPPIIAPTLPGTGQQALVLRRCDDGGDGGVLIDGICL